MSIGGAITRSLAKNKKMPNPASVKRQERRIREKKRKLEAITPSEARQEIDEVLDEVRATLISGVESFTKNANIKKLAKLPKITNELAEAIAAPAHRILINASDAATKDQLLDLLETTGSLVPRGTAPSRASLAQYLGTVDGVRKLVDGGATPDKIPGFDFLKDVRAVRAAVDDRYQSITTRKTKYSNLAAIAGRLQGFEKEHAIYGKLGKEGNQEYVSKQEDNLLSEKQSASWISWDDVERLRPAIAKMSLRDQAIFSVYVDQPPRRLKDYMLMRIWRSEAGGEVPDPTGNWLLVNKQGLPTGFSISDYKTGKTMGVFKEPVLKKTPLFKSLVNHLGSIENDTAEHMEILFPTRAGDFYKEGSFSLLVTLIFKQATNEVLGREIPVTANILRHSYISNIISKGLFPTVSQRKRIAAQMGHSKITQDLYAKIN